MRSPYRRFLANRLLKSLFILGALYGLYIIYVGINYTVVPHGLEDPVYRITGIPRTDQIVGVSVLIGIIVMALLIWHLARDGRPLDFASNPATRRGTTLLVALLFLNGVAASLAAVLDELSSQFWVPLFGWSAAVLALQVLVVYALFLPIKQSCADRLNASCTRRPCGRRGCPARGDKCIQPFCALSVPAITPGHVRPRPGLVEKDQPFGNQPRLLVAPSGSRRRDVRATQPLIAKRRALRLDPLGGQQDAKLVNGVMSQFSITRARMRSPWGARFDFFQPPYLSALIVPRCFQRCISFTTKLMLTSNCFAAALREVPDSTTRTTRSRRSSE